MPGELAGQLDADGHADEHPQAGLLRHERRHRGPAGVGIGLARGAADLLVVGLGEPAALGQGVIEHALELGRAITVEEVAPVVADAFAQVFELERVEGEPPLETVSVVVRWR